MLNVITNVNEIENAGAYQTPNGSLLNIVYKGLNFYGNPTYHLYMDSDMLLKVKNTKNHVGRVLTDKQGLKYLTFTTYNLANTINYLQQHCDLYLGF